MNKLKKIGLSALCGSLAAVSANAGELSVSGGATITYSSNEKETTGNPLGMASAVGFAGSGELDNGWTVNLAIDNNDKSAYSASSLTLTTNSIGSFKVVSGSGGVGLAAMDDKMPSAWEETWGTSLGTSVNLQKGVGSGQALAWKLPTVAGVTLEITHSPKNDGAQVSDKAGSGGAVSGLGKGTDVSLNINPSFGIDALSGVNIFGAYSVTDKENPDVSAGTNDDLDEDTVEEGTVGMTVAIGPLTVGAQVAGEYLGVRGSVDRTAAAGYKNNFWGASFNVNDNLSISYGEMESRKMFEQQGDYESVELTAESWQIAYTMGGASIKIAETDATNIGYSTTAYNDRGATTLALTLAF